MAHSDDDGLVLPPYAAPTVVAIVPIFKSDAERQAVQEFADRVVAALAGPNEVAAGMARLSSDGLRHYFVDSTTAQKIVVDWRDARPGDKQYHWEQRGVPLRMEIGPRDVAAGTMVLKRRFDREKIDGNPGGTVPTMAAGADGADPSAMYEKAKEFRDQNTRHGYDL